MVNPTGYTALDMIGFTDQGTYSSSDNYVKNDLVHYGGNIWRCLIDDTSGIAPAEGVNWTLFIGEPTNLVERIIAPVETDPATNAWAVGRQIIYNDNLYEVIVAITAGDALVAYEDDPTNANIKLADPVETQLLNEKAARAAADLALQNALSHRNLLDNPWFTVNQRNFSSSNSTGYTVDRWQLVWNPNGCTVTKTADGLSIDNTQSGAGITYIFQKLESKDIAGKTLTATVLLSDGTLLKGTGVMPQLDGPEVTPISDQVRHIGVTYQYSTTGSLGLCAFRLDIEADCLLTIKAVKLELGSVSTLAMDTAPNYATELLKCQRYFVRLKNITSTFSVIATGFIQAPTYAWVAVSLPVTMRATPTITLIKATESAIVIQARGDVAGQAKVVTSISHPFLGSNMLKFNAIIDSQTDYEVGLPVFLWISDTTNSSSIDLSADL